MIGMHPPQYQTCQKCHHQSEIPQTTDCLAGIWEECPKCGSREWDLEEKKGISTMINWLFNVFK